MKFQYSLTYPQDVLTNTQPTYESQLRQFCSENRFSFSSFFSNEFNNGTKVVWGYIEWMKYRKYPNKDLVYNQDGSIKKDSKIIESIVKVFPSYVEINVAKEVTASELLRKIFSPPLYNNEFSSNKEKKEEETSSDEKKNEEEKESESQIDINIVDDQKTPEETNSQCEEQFIPSELYLPSKQLKEMLNIGDEIKISCNWADLMKCKNDDQKYCACGKKTTEESV